MTEHSVIIGGHGMPFNVVRRNNRVQSVVSTVDELRQAFDEAGSYACESYSLGKTSAVFAVVQEPEGLLICLCQVQPGIGLHYWSPREPQSAISNV